MARLQILVTALLLPGLTIWTSPVMANPSGGVIVHGDVNIGAGTGGNLQIRQNSRSAIINWESFSIQQGEMTQFRQTGPNAAVLNRVTGGDPSAIHGAMKANGNVFVINPNGILVGPGGTIDVRGVVLSTLDVSNGEFLAGGDMTFAGAGEGVTNLGRINAVGGDVFLIGKTVSNSGSIRSESGVAGLAAGEEVLLTANESATGERMFVRATGAGASGTGVYNDGTIEGAAVELKAHGNMYALAINNKGSVRATGATSSGGRVYLRGAGGTVSHSGSIRAASSGVGSGGRVLIEAAYAKVDGLIRAQGGSVRIAGGAKTEIGGQIDASSSVGRGGDVVVEGDGISVASSASIDASGDTRGGNVRIGGGFQGRDATVRNADTLDVAAGSKVRADALSSGRGGNVILWSDGDTLYLGDISAHGVSSGGFAEISGKQNLGFDGTVDVLADNGPAGTVLLDPTNVRITSEAAANDVVNNIALSNLLDLGNNVVINTDFGAIGVAGDITVGRNTSQAIANGDRVEWYQESAGTVPGTLTLLAMGNVTFNTSVRSAGVGGINVVAGWNGNTGIVDVLDLDNITDNAIFNMGAILDTMPGGATSGLADAAGNAPFLGAPQGSIFVNSAAGRTFVEVGSRYGATNFAAHDIFLKASDAPVLGAGELAPERYTQVGFRDTGYEFELATANNGLRNEWWANPGTTTPLESNIQGKNYIDLFAPGGTYAQSLANGFRPAGSGAIGAITLRASGRIDMRSSDEDRGYVQIGHGGSVQEGFEVNRSGTNLQLTTRDGIVMDPIDANWQFFGSTWRTNTELNPYRGSLFRIDAPITVHAGEDLLVMAAFDFDGTNRDITNEDASAGQYALIGHGGSENWGSFHGNISVTADGVNTDTVSGRLGGAGIELRGGRGSNSFAQIGHGTHGEGNRRTIYDLTRSGNINVTATTGGIRMLGFNQMPRTGDVNTGTYLGTTTPTGLASGSDDRNFFNPVQIGHGGALSAAPEVLNTNDGGGALPTAGSPGPPVVPPTPAGSNFTYSVFGSTLASRDIIPGFKERPDFSMAGDVNVFAGGNMTIRDIGDVGPGVDPYTSAGTNREIGVQIWAGNAQVSYGQIGHGGQNQFVNTGLIAANNGGTELQGSILTGSRGNISVTADRGGILAIGGEERRSDLDDGYGFDWVQIGHGGQNVSAFRDDIAGNGTLQWDNNPGFEGAITLSAGQGPGAATGDILFNSGRMRSSWAMVGHGGSTSRANIAGSGTSNIGVTASGKIEFTSRISAPTEFWLSSDYVDARVIDINSAGLGSLSNFAGTASSANRTPQLTISNLVQDTALKFAKIGHGGSNFVEIAPVPPATNVYSQNNTITVTAQGGGIEFTGGDRDLDFIQIGHGGTEPTPGHVGSIVNGTITVSAAGDVIFDASNPGFTSDQRTTNLGAPIFNGSGTVVGLDGLNERGNGFGVFAMIGNGGRDLDGDHSGAITVTTTNGGDLLMIGSNGAGTQTVTGFTGHRLQGPSGEFSMFGTVHSLTTLEEASRRSRHFTLFHGNGGAGLIQGDIVPNSLVIDSTADVRDAPNGDGITGTLYRSDTLIAGNYAVGTHGAALGTIDYTTGVVTVIDRVHTNDGEFARNVDYSYVNNSVTQAINDERTPESDAALRASQVYLGHGGLVAGTVKIIVDGDGNGAGRQVIQDTTFAGTLFNEAGVNVGSVDYTTGRINFIATINTAGDEVVADYQYGGLKDQSFVQLGNGGLGSSVGANTTPGHTGQIIVNAAGDVRFHAGEHDGNYAQLGHGGRGTQGQHGIQGAVADPNVNTSGNITLTSGGIVEFLAGRGFGIVERSQYAQIGHGGNDADGNHAGRITINAGSGFVSSAPGTIGGGATLAGLNFRGGSTEQAYVQVGHGGYQARSGGAGIANAFGMYGNISAVADGSIVFTAGTLQRPVLLNNNDSGAYALFGHGGWDADWTSDAVGVTGAGIGHNGNLTVRSTLGAIAFSAGSLASGSEGAGEGRYQFAQLGHGGFSSNGNHNGNITAEAAGSITFTGGTGNSNNAVESISYAQLGHGGHSSQGNMGLRDGGGNASQTIRVRSGGDVAFAAGIGQDNYAQLGNGGRLSLGDHAANINVFAEGSLSFTTSQSDHLTGAGPTGSNRYFNNTNAAAQNLNAASDVTPAGANLWNQKIVPGSVVISVDRQATGLGSTFTDVRDTPTSLTGTIVAANSSVVGTINYVTGAVAFTSQLHTGTANANNVSVSYRHTDSGLAYAQLGNGGHNADIGGTASTGHVGEITVAARTGHVLLQAGNDDQTYAQIGNGGYTTDGSGRGNIFVRAAGNVSLLGGTGNSLNTSKFMYAQIGHGGHQSGTTAAVGHTGTIMVSSGTGALFSNLGTGRFNDVFDLDGDTVKDEVIFGADVSTTGVLLQGGAGLEVAGVEVINDDPYAMIGHGGRSSGGNHSGNIGVSAMKDISLLSSSAYRSFTQVGHGGLASNGNLSGSISVISETGNIAVRAGAPVAGVNTFEAYSLIGHGDDRNVNSDASNGIATGSRLGRIFVLADHITLDRSDADLAFIGHTFRTTAAASSNDPFSAQTLTTPASNLGGGYQVIGRSGLSYMNNGVMTTGGGAVGTGTILINDSFRERYINPNIRDGHFAFTGGNLVIDTLLSSTAGSAYANALSHPNNLTFLAAGDIDQNFDIQNPGAGSVNLVAGVNIERDSIVNDGAAFPRIDHLVVTPIGRIDMQAVRDDRTQFGQQGLGTGGFGPFEISSGEFSDLAGEVSIDATPRAIAVGSRNGSTDVMGYRINLFAGNGANESAQIGFRFNGAFSGTTGMVKLRALEGGVHLRAGSGASNGAYSQVGHGGSNATGNQTGDICVQSDGSITFNDVAPGTGVGSYAQIGNGGLNADGNHLGYITVVAGHTATGHITMNGGGGVDQYVQIGHGGHNADGAFGDTMANGRRGRISVVANTGGNLSITGGGGNGSYGMIGHGDGRGTYASFASGSSSGTRQGGIQTFVDGDLVLNAGPTNANVYMTHRTTTGGGLQAAGSYLGGDGYVNVVNGATIGVPGQGTPGVTGPFEHLNTMVAGNVGFGNIVINHIGDLTVNDIGPSGFGADFDDEFVNHGFAFIVLATGNLTFNRSIQNQGTGMVALVAGWDGNTGNFADGSVNFNAGLCDPQIIPQTIDFANCDSFGQNGKVLTIGDAARTTPVEVGSRQGPTILRGDTINIVAGSGAGASAQIGYLDTGSPNELISGTIDVRAKVGGLNLLAGTGVGAFSQIGHRQTTNEITDAATISITFCDPGVITLNGGASGAFAQIGHGGTGSNALRGNISVTNFGGVSLNSGIGAGAFTQIGHGGLSRTGAIFGTTTLDGTGAVNLLSGTGTDAYARIGSGGNFHNGAITDGTVSVTASSVFMRSQSGTRANTQIGAGGHGTVGNITGDVSVTTTAGGISIDGQGGAGSGNYTQIGAGGLNGVGAGNSLLSSTTLSATGGDVSVNSLTAAYAQIGAGGFNLDAAAITGAVSVTATGRVDLVAGSSADRYAMIGLGGGNSDAAKSGELTVSGSDVSLTGGSSTSASAQIGHGGAASSGVVSASNIAVDSVNGITVTGGGDSAYAQIGHGGYNAFNTTVTGSNIILNGATGTGNGDIVITGGTGDNAAAIIGHGGSRSLANAGMGDTSAVGAVTLTKAANVRLVAGSSADAFAQIGHAAERAAGNWSGDITVNSDGEISVTGGSQIDTLAMIGHGGVSAGTAGNGVRSGNISLTAGGNVTVATGTGDAAFAQVGHGGGGSQGNLSGVVTVVTTGGGMTLTGGSGTNAYAQVGHGGLHALGDFSGATTATATGAVSLQGGGSANGYALAGLGGGGWNGAATDAGVDVRGSSVSLVSGAGDSAFTQIGSGGGASSSGAATTGNASGAVNVVATSGGVTVDGGDGNRAYSQIGHGGHARSGDFTGDIQVVSAADFILAGGATLGAHAIVGHGGRTDAAVLTSGVRQGNVLARVAGLTSVTDNTSVAFLGHRGSAGVSGASRLALVTSQLSTVNSAAHLTGMISNMIGTGNVEIGVTNGDLVVGGAPANFNSANHLDLFASGNTTFQNSLQNSGSGAITGVAGWNGTTGLIETINNAAFPPITSLSLDAAAVEADPAAYSNNGGVLAVGDGSQTIGVAVGSRQGRTSMLGDRVLVAGGTANVNLFAQIGFRGTSAQAITGAIHVGAGAGGFDILGSSMVSGFAQVGHGGLGSVNAPITADITFRSSDVNVTGGSAAGSYGKLGHGGTSYNSAMSGDITALGPVGVVGVTGGDGLTSYAQIGHGGDLSAAAKGGNISITAEEFILQGGNVGARAGAQIGHGGRGGSGALTGNIALASTIGGVSLTTAGGAFSAAQIGMGGQGYTGSAASSSITVQSALNVDLQSGAAVQSAAMIGNGGANALGDFGGNITVTAPGDVTLLSGSQLGAFTQIGNGGSQASGNHSGNIVVTSGDDLSITAPNSIATYAYGKIGHGDDMRNLGAGGGGTRSGNIEVSADSDITVVQGMIGHINSLSGATATGTTFIGASRATPTDPTGGNLVVDANSEISGVDGLRLYVPRRQNNQVAAGAFLNGVSYAGGQTDPAITQRNDEYTRFVEISNSLAFLNQHDNSLGSGLAPANAGNFAFYFDTIVQVPAPDQPLPPVVTVPTVPPGLPTPDYRGTILDDWVFDDWVRDEEYIYTAPGFTLVFYEGFLQYGPNGQPIYNFGITGDEGTSSEDEEEILRRMLRLLRDQQQRADQASQDSGGGTPPPTAPLTAPVDVPVIDPAPAAPAATQVPDPFGAE